MKKLVVIFALCTVGCGSWPTAICMPQGVIEEIVENQKEPLWIIAIGIR
jgi:hypothetical protein